MTARIVVLLATRNGQRWLPEQMASILNQQHVDVRVVALDDESTDGTVGWIDNLAANDPRVTRLATESASGSSAANFFRLITRAEVADGELIAFADQDDVWMPGKLARQARLIAENGVDGVSSNVTSFTPDGTRTLIRKDHPQRRFDYLLQSPGPGSTFLITRRLFDLVRLQLREHPDIAARIDYHDSFMYVVARARQWRWLIDPEPTVDYRQHQHNVIGANVGVASAVARLRLIGARWHRRQAIAMCELAIGIAREPLKGDLQRIHALLTTSGVHARLRLARHAGDFRRRARDRMVIAALMVSGVW
ncbi:glycosyltransferase [Salinibacterium sp.]|uniref:glycosyltransferase n=1 Tax=Salinibacterium sp. TaxID=1915057 RepID=UPI00286B404B|nr:glycosyltransferase [Salinibacterium sp.]